MGVAADVDVIDDDDDDDNNLNNAIVVDGDTEWKPATKGSSSSSATASAKKSKGKVSREEEIGRKYWKHDDESTLLPKYLTPAISRHLKSAFQKNGFLRETTEGAGLALDDDPVGIDMVMSDQRTPTSSSFLPPSSSSLTTMNSLQSYVRLYRSYARGTNDDFSFLLSSSTLAVDFPLLGDSKRGLSGLVSEARENLIVTRAGDVYDRIGFEGLGNWCGIDAEKAKIIFARIVESGEIMGKVEGNTARFGCDPRTSTNSNININSNGNNNSNSDNSNRNDEDDDVKALARCVDVANRIKNERTRQADKHPNKKKKNPLDDYTGDKSGNFNIDEDYEMALEMSIVDN